MRFRSIVVALLIGAIALAGGIVCTAPAQAAQAAQVLESGLKLPAIFSDNMVLQRDMRVPVWGWAAPGEKVTVTFQNQKKSATAGKDGKWMVKLGDLKAGGPFEMNISGGKTVTIRNILVGEVWVASGQSNMEWSLRNTTGADQAIAEAKFPKIRLFTVPKAKADVPQTDVVGQWMECTPETAPSFSAVAYHFGRELHQKLNVPVGLIHTSWGGSPVEVWTKQSVLEQDPEWPAVRDNFASQLANYEKAKVKHEAAMKAHAAARAKAAAEGKEAPKPPQAPRQPWVPTTLYNAMIAPIAQYGIAGAIWYQGESNAGAAGRYARQFPAMIRNWRSDWDQGNFPFLFVQLANYMARETEPSESAWAELREAQLKTLALSKTGMAVIIDIGEANDIHPRNKLDVGRRLAFAARAVAYGEKKLVYSGPIYDSMKVQGNTIRLKFEHVGGGLLAKDGPVLKGFAIAGADRKFVWADAKIDGDSIVVSSQYVTKPVAVRYAWGNNPECNLYNKDGLPASPFRTDNWPRPAAPAAK